MKRRLECVVTGRVQMVMFRDFVARNARKLGLTGTVQNCMNGSVHIIAEGDELSLKQFLPIIAKGSMLSSVEDVQVTWGDATGEYSTFTITYK